MKLLRPLLYCWAFPGTLVGLSLIPLALFTGGGVQLVDGILEAYGAG